jgi:hypothetical protein
MIFPLEASLETELETATERSGKRPGLVTRDPRAVNEAQAIP